MLATSEEKYAVPGTDEPQLFTIEQIATRTGLTKRTLRYYEEMGLLLPTERTEGNYRRYSEADAERIERIKELRDLLGFSLSEIRSLLEGDAERSQIREAYRQETDAVAKAAQLERSNTLLRTQLQLIEHKMAGLEQMRTTILKKLERHDQMRKDLLNTIDQ